MSILARIVCIMTFTLFSLNVIGQTTQKRLKNGPIDDAMRISRTNIDSALVIWKGAESYAKNHKDKQELSYWYYIGTHIYRLKNDKEKFQYYGRLAQRDYLATNDKLGLSMIYLVYGNKYFDDFALDSARYYYTKTIEIKKTLNDEEGLGIALSNLGTVEDYSGDFAKASNLYFESIKLNQKVGNETQLADTYHNLSIVQYNLGNIENAILYQNKAIGINQRLKNQYSESMNHVCLAAFYLELNNTKDSEIHAKTAETLSIKLNDSRGLLYSQSALGLIAMI